MVDGEPPGILRQQVFYHLVGLPPDWRHMLARALHWDFRIPIWAAKTVRRFGKNQLVTWVGTLNGLGWTASVPEMASLLPWATCHFLLCLCSQPRFEAQSGSSWGAASLPGACALLRNHRADRRPGGTVPGSQRHAAEGRSRLLPLLHPLRVPEWLDHARGLCRPQPLCCVAGGRNGG